MRPIGLLSLVVSLAVLNVFSVQTVRGGSVLVAEAQFSPPADAPVAELGTDVAIDGDVAVLGTPGGTIGLESGGWRHRGAYVIVRDPSSGWGSPTPLELLRSPGTDPTGFGLSVAISGDTVVIGAPQEDMADPANSASTLNMAGAAYVFVREGSLWVLQARLVAAVPGDRDKFGSRIAIDGNTIAVAAPTEDGASTGINGDPTNVGAVESGAVYVFGRSGSTWTQTAYIKASNTDAGDWFGFSIDIDADTLVVGAAGEASSSTGTVGSDQSDDESAFAGAAYVFKRNAGAWSQQSYLKPSNTRPGFFFGGSVTVSGDMLAVGAPGEDSSATGVGGNQNGPFADDAGATFVFTRSNTTWSQQAYLKASNTEIDDEFGGSVALDGDKLVVGAMNESSGATGINGSQSDDSQPSAGAAYMFLRTGTAWSQVAYAKASDTDEHDTFGQAVDISGGAVLIGAPGDNVDQQMDDVHGGHLFRWINDATPPQTQAVALSVRQGGQINSAPVAVSWAADDDTSDVWQLKHTVDIRKKTSAGWSSWRQVAAGVGDMELNTTTALGKVFQARVRTRDDAGNWSAWALSNTLKASTRQEANFSTSGQWTAASDPQAMGDRVIRSRKANANARLTFTGRGVSAVMPVGPPLGTARMCVDRGRASEECVVVNLASAGTGPRWVVAVFDGLPLGNHTLDVKVVSGLVILDGAIVFE